MGLRPYIVGERMDAVNSPFKFVDNTDIRGPAAPEEVRDRNDSSVCTIAAHWQFPHRITLSKSMTTTQEG